MKIVFDKVGSTAKPFEVSSEGIKLEGTLKKSGSHQVTLDAHMSGCTELNCDRCGDTYNYDMDNRLQLKLSDLVCGSLAETPHWMSIKFRFVEYGSVSVRMEWRFRDLY